jgi:hypothetical protein
MRFPGECQLRDVRPALRYRRRHWSRRPGEPGLARLSVPISSLARGRLPRPGASRGQPPRAPRFAEVLLREYGCTHGVQASGGRAQGSPHGPVEVDELAQAAPHVLARPPGRSSLDEVDCWAVRSLLRSASAGRVPTRLASSGNMVAARGVSIMSRPQQRRRTAGLGTTMCPHSTVVALLDRRAPTASIRSHHRLWVGAGQRSSRRGRQLDHRLGRDSRALVWSPVTGATVPA